MKKDDKLDLDPLGNAVVIRAFVVEKTKGGIIMPNKDSIKLSEGRVLAVGPSARRVKVGDLVLYGKNVGSKLERNGQTYTICFDSHIECRIIEEKFNQDNLVRVEE